MEKLIKSDIPITCSVKHDKYIAASEREFDCIFDGTSRFYPWVKPQIPTEFGLGVIVGGSGTGKTNLLKEFGIEETPIWNNDKSIMSHFDSPEEAIDILSAVGLNSIPSWYKPYNVLSNGEMFRANLARKLKTGAVIDEYTSVVDRNVAKAASTALSKYIKRKEIKNVVLATCHEDIIPWLEPDWVINTDTGEMCDGFFLSDQKSISKYIKETAICGPCLKTITI